MHHFLFTIADTFIDNSSNHLLKNFGTDYNVCISACTKTLDIFQSSSLEIVNTGEIEITGNVQNFSGTFSGSLISGSALFISGSVIVSCGCS